MKLHFEPNLDYQLQAIEAICDLFRGQEICRTEFTVTKCAVGGMQDLFDAGLGVGNRLTLLDDELIANLNFVIVVPSVAIKEGVYKSLQITEEHFKGLYAGVPFDYFLYDSAKLGQVRNFATSAQIQIMVVTVGAINKKDVNNLYKDSEKTGGEKPIDLIKATRPIVIVDEPQSVDGGLEGRGKEALDAMNPLCTLRYSATHVDKHHMVHRLDAVDAYEQRLVKQIEVASATVEDAHNKPYVRLIAVSNKRGTISAKVELDVQTATGVRRGEVPVHDGDNLEQTTGRAVYADCRVGEIRVAKGDELLELRVPGGEQYLRPGQAYGDVDALAVQREMIRRTIIEAETGIRFGVVEPHQFAAVSVTAADGSATPLGLEESKALWEHLKDQGYIDAKGKVQDTLRTALKDGTLALPESVAAQAGQIGEILRKLAGRLEIKNADERRQVRPRQAILQSPDFKALWDRIKHKTTYRVQFDNEKLVASCIKALRDAPAIPKTRLQWRKADIAIGKAGVEATEREGAQTVILDETDIELPDVLTELQDRTQLTRRTIHRVLTGSGRLDDFKRNPQAFIELAGEAINRCKRLAVVDGIRYQRLGDEQYYAQELFEQEELTGYLKNMLADARKSVYEQVVYDSGTEADFADALEKNEAIKLYAKLPGWFKVPTPLGTYNPDWAVLLDKDGSERLYLVVETKSGLFTDDLRDKERAKIECGKAHFTALEVRETPARYLVARSIDEVLAAS